VAAELFRRGVVLIGVVDERGVAHPLYTLASQALPMQVDSVLGIALDQNALFDEFNYAIRHFNPVEVADAETLTVRLQEQGDTLRLLIMGWVGSLPLLLKRLLDEYERIEVRLIDDFTVAERDDQLAYLQRRIGSMEGAGERIGIEVERWNYSDMNALHAHMQGMDRIILSQPLHMNTEAYAVIATTLSHMISIIKHSGAAPDIFPVLNNRREARLLQEELDRFSLPAEVHIIVPNEFYGTYVAHTSYHMYTSETPEVYQMQRTLRHALDDLMGDVGQDDSMGLQTVTVTEPLPEDAGELYLSLLKQGYLWIGYRLNSAFIWSDPLQEIIRRYFPRKEDFSCLRQHQIIINPFGNPVSRQSWLNYREEIAELIVIAEDISS